MASIPPPSGEGPRSPDYLRPLEPPTADSSVPAQTPSPPSPAPPQLPSEPEPEPEPADATALAIILGVLVAVFVAVSILRANKAGEDSAFASGQIVGALVIIGVVGLVATKLKSKRTGLLAALVAAGLCLLGGLGQLATADDGSWRDLSKEESECMESRGLEESAVSAFAVGVSSETFDAMREVLNGLQNCAPRFLTGDDFVRGWRSAMDPALRSATTEEETRCLIAELMKSGDFVAAANDFDLAVSATEQCYSEETLAALAEGGPQALGDDETLDTFHSECTAGSDLACDVLWWLSGEGTEYEAQALDCGGRTLPASGYCTTGAVDDDLDGLIDDNSPIWDDLPQRCTDGEMLACDWISFHSGANSPHYVVGITCGERTRQPDYRTCVDSYGLVAT